VLETTLIHRGEEEASSVVGRLRPFPTGNTKGDRLMQRLVASISRFLREEDGPTAVEYAVMLALIIVVCIAAVTTLGSNASNTFSNASLNIAAGVTSGTGGS
jgi:pilus assembly protein Flp/PilA